MVENAQGREAEESVPPGRMKLNSSPRPNRSAVEAAPESAWLDRITWENPDPILQVSTDYVILYCNPAAEVLCRQWGCHQGQRAPAPVQESVSAALAATTTVRREVTWASRTFWLTIAPFPADGYVTIYAKDITERKQAEEDLRRIEWMLTAKPREESQLLYEDAVQPYGDLAQLNAAGLIRTSVGEPILRDIVSDYLSLLETASAVFEKNGSYACGLFSSGWCRFLDVVSRERCATPDNRAALGCGHWHCHESCWNEASRRAIETGEPVDVECAGGIRMHAVPIRAGTEIVGSINVGYGDPPRDPQKLAQIAGRYGVTVADLQQRAQEYQSRPPFIIDLAKQRLTRSAQLIGEIVQRKHLEEALRESDQRLRLALESGKMGTWEWEVGTEHVEWSPGYYRLLGWRPGTLQPTWTAFETCVHPEDRPRQERLLRQSLEQCEDYNCEFRVLWPDGSVHWVEARGRYTYDPGDGATVIRMHGVLTDIDQRKLAEEDLRRSAAILAQAGRLANLGAWEIEFEDSEDINKNPLRWSDQVYRLFGYEPGSVQVTNDLFYQHVHPEDRPRVAAAVARSLAGKRPYEVEHRIVRTDNTERIVHEYADVQFDAQGHPVRMIGAVQDITERKQAEEALRRSETRLRAVMDALPVGVFIADPQGRILSTNPAADTIWGAPPVPQGSSMRESRKGWWADTGRWVQPHEWALAAAVRNGQPHDPQEIEIACEDGTHKTIIDYATPIRDDHGRIVGAIAVHTDVTARRQAEDTLRKTADRFRRAIENASAAVVIATLDGGIRYANPAFLTLVGYTEEDMQTGVLRWDRITPPEYAPVDAEAVRELRETGVARPREKEYLTKDGRRVPVLMSGAITGYGPEGEPQVVAFVTDITSRKQIEAELRRWNVQLEQEVQARTEELRESVDRLNEEVARRILAEEDLRKRSAMLEERAWQLQQLTLELSQAEDRERKRLAEILHDDLQQLLAAAKFHLGLLDARLADDDSVQELAATVRDLLKQAIAKSRSLSHELSPPALSRSDLSDIFEWLAQQVQTKHGLVVDLEAFDRVPLQSEPLKAFLYKAAQEMLFNIVKHAGVKEARLRLTRHGGRIYLSVADQGRGFDSHMLGKPGFGLLSIQERVKLLGGRMKVRSVEGRGSIFVLAVPDPEPSKREDGAEKIEAEKRRTEDAEQTTGNKRPETEDRERTSGDEIHPASDSVLRVLLVDDHKIVRQGIRAMLVEAPDIEVVGEAGNGREAIESADRLAPDVIVMDMSMPVMAGDEATRQIKQRRPKTRIVALSMFDDTRVADRMRKAGAAAYVLKTAPAEELLAAIRGNEPLPLASDADTTRPA